MKKKDAWNGSKTKVSCSGQFLATKLIERQLNILLVLGHLPTYKKLVFRILLVAHSFLLLVADITIPAHFISLLSCMYFMCSLCVSSGIITLHL